MRTDVAKYNWVRLHGEDDGGAYLFVKNQTMRDVLNAFRVAPESLVERVSMDILPVDPNSHVCHVAVMPDSSANWVAISEHGTHFQSYPLLEPLSQGAMAIQCAFPWGRPAVTIAVNGQSVRLINTDHYDPAGALPEEECLPFKEAGPQAALLLIERITGLQMTPQWMLGPFKTAPAQLS